MRQWRWKRWWWCWWFWEYGVDDESYDCGNATFRDIMGEQYAESTGWSTTCNILPFYEKRFGRFCLRGWLEWWFWSKAGLGLLMRWSRYLTPGPHFIKFPKYDSYILYEPFTTMNNYVSKLFEMRMHLEKQWRYWFMHPANPTSGYQAVCPHTSLTQKMDLFFENSIMKLWFIINHDSRHACIKHVPDDVPMHMLEDR